MHQEKLLRHALFLKTMKARNYGFPADPEAEEDGQIKRQLIE